MFRALTLYALSARQLIRRLISHLGEELVIGSCSLILVALFYYIFSDFIAHEVQAISPELSQTLGTALAFLVLSASAMKAGAYLCISLAQPEQFAAFAARLGESPRVLTYLRLLWLPSLLLYFYVPSFVLVSCGFVHWHTENYAGAFACCLLITALSWGVCRIQENKGPQQLTLLSPSPWKRITVIDHPLITMWWWRFQQLVFRHPRARVFLLLGSAGLLLTNYCLLKSAADLLVVVAAYFTGIAVAFSLILFIADDCKSLWIEKECGVSHNLFFASLELLGLSIGAVFLVLQGSLMGLVWGFAAPPTLGGLLMLKIVAIMITPSCIVPALALQIDGKRPGVQMISVILVSLLLTTAIFAQLLSVLLLPLVSSYGRSSQRDRYYYL